MRAFILLAALAAAALVHAEPVSLSFQVRVCDLSFTRAWERKTGALPTRVSTFIFNSRLRAAVGLPPVMSTARALSLIR
jgi:hypothetical protein